MASSQTATAAAKLKSNTDKIEEKYGDEAFKLTDNGYKARYFPENEKEKDLRLLTAYAREVGEPGYIKIDKKDIEIIKEKSRARTLAQYDAFLETLFNLNDPKDVRKIREYCPDYFKRREDEMNRKLELQKEIQRMKLYGIQDKKDTEILFEANNVNGINIKNEASWVNNPINQRRDLASYTRGFFNVHRLFPDYRVDTNNLGNEIDYLGTPNDMIRSRNAMRRDREGILLSPEERFAPLRRNFNVLIPPLTDPQLFAETEEGRRRGNPPIAFRNIGAGYYGNQSEFGRTDIVDDPGRREFGIKLPNYRLRDDGTHAFVQAVPDDQRTARRTRGTYGAQIDAGSTHIDNLQKVYRFGQPGYRYS